jgi:hypothetical protein
VQDPGKPVRQPAEGVVVLDAVGAQLVVGLRCCPSMSLNTSASGGASWNAITPRSRFQTRSTGAAYSSRSTAHGLPLLVPPGVAEQQAVFSSFSFDAGLALKNTNSIGFVYLAPDLSERHDRRRTENAREPAPGTG